MNRILSLLMVFVFLQTQSWALSGGPFGSGNASSTLTGTYAGVLVPQIAPVIGTSSAVGLFSLVQADTGFATGTISLFINGTAFNGGITGIMDPKRGAFRGVINAASSITIQVPVSTTSIVNGVPVVTTTIQNRNISAQGNMDAEVAPDTERNAFLTTASSATRIKGTAVVDIFVTIDPTTGTPNVTQTTAFDVDGFKQADT
jgi:hypothetical protein